MTKEQIRGCQAAGTAYELLDETLEIAVKSETSDEADTIEPTIIVPGKDTIIYDDHEATRDDGGGGRVVGR